MAGLAAVAGALANRAQEDSEFQQFLEASEDSGEDGLPPEGPRQLGGTLRASRRSSEIRGSLANQRKVKGLERLQHEYAAKVAAAEDARGALEDEEQKLRTLRKQAEAGTLADPARLGYQEREVSKAWERLTESEKSRDAAELALHRIADEGAAATGQARQEAARAAAVAQARHASEMQRARRTVSVDRAGRDASHAHARAHSSELARRDTEARKHQSRSLQRLRDTHGHHRGRLEEAEQVRESHFDHDAQRLLTLKASIDGINKQVKSANEVRKKKEQKVKEEREQRKKDLLNEGQNPYEVWRKEEMDAEKRRQKEKLQAATELRQEKLLEQLMEEDRRYKLKRKEEKEKRVEADNFQKEMGNYAKEKKIATYIRKMTVDSVDVLDPTGTAVRIDPSKVTVQKTHAFGLGRARPEEIEKVERSVRAANARLAGSPSPIGSPDFAGSQPEAAEAAPSSSSPAKKLPVVTGQYMKQGEAAGAQGVGGKEWKGDAFLAKPSTIAFHDFEVGKRYKQVIEVTNVSLTLKFNQFKLLPLEDKIRDFFEIQFEPPGRMSAGVTTSITIIFTPKVNADIDSTFPIQAITGRIDFPLICTTKKTVLSFAPQDEDANPVVDFGKVLSGESEQRTLHIKNSGALPAKFRVEAADPNNEMLRMVTWAPEKGEFPAHSTTKIVFSFLPEAVDSYAAVLTLCHGATDDGEFTEEMRVLIQGECLNVPIYVEREVYNLRTCIFGHTFRESVVVHNRQSVAKKIHVERPKQLEGELQLNPTLAYIQGHKSQAIQVKFSPKEDFLDRNQQYRDPSQGVSGAFRIPLRIVGADQALPVDAALVGVLTTNRISFLPPSLNFGRCFVGSSVASRLTVINESHLPQQFAFLRLPPFLSVQDVPTDVLEEESVDGSGTGVAVLEGGGDGALGMLLPQERRELCVTFAPEAATETDCKITFKAITGSLCASDFSIGCKGQGVAPILSLSHSKLDLASVPCDAVSKESVVVTNVSKVACTMNLLLPPPEISALHASPVCCTLKPGEARRLQFTFKPTQEYVSLLQPPPEEPKPDGGADPPAGDAAAAEQAEAADAQEPPAPTPEEYRLQRLREVREHGGRRWEADAGGTAHATWKLAICMRPQAGQASSSRPRSDACVYLGVSTCALQSALAVEPLTVDFGEVPAQQRGLLPLSLRSLDAAEQQELHIDPLPENQCFTVLSAPRSFGAGKPLQLMVEFKPQQVQIYQSTLQLRTQSTRVQVPLVGRGVRPVLKIEPEDGVIHLGSIVYSKDCRDYSTAQLLVKNVSPFELSYNLESVIPADPNHAGAPPFTLTPSSGTVEANGQRLVTVTFRPHRPLAVFKEKVFVNVPNQKEPTYVYLYGHCFDYQAYAISGMDFGPFGRAEARPSPVFVDALAVGRGSGASADGEARPPKAQQTEFFLQFERGERMKPLHLLVGACAPPGTPLAPQNAPAASYRFEVVPSEFSSYFAIEAPEGGKVDSKAEGPLQPGSAKKQAAEAKPDKQVKVLFRYNPPKDASLAYAGVDLDLLGGIGQWITCKVQGWLKGGYVPPSEPPGSAQEFTVTLKAYLQQI